MRRAGSGGGPHGLSCRALHGVSSGIHGAVVLSLSGVALAGCTAMLGIDGEYVQENRVGATGGAASLSGGGSSTGGAGSGGITDSDVKPASGGESLATGGTAPVNDAEVPQCTAGTDECGNGMKCCLGTCVPAEPLSGCSALACDPCPRPPDVAVAICDDGRCANKCNDGYRLVGDQSATQVCEVIATNTGGAPGNGGASNGGAAATGGTPPCVPEECPATGHRCLNPLQGWLHCCKNDNTCGCTWAPELPRADLPAPYCL